MATLEEMRQKRIEETRQRRETSVIPDAQKEIQRIRESRTSSFSKPAPDTTEDLLPDDSSAGKAFRRSATVNALPTLGGIGAGAATGAAVGTVAGPLGTIAGFIGGGIVGAIFTKKAQDEVLEVVKGEEWKRNLDQSIAEDRQNHPYATLAGEAAPALLTFRPSPTTLKQAFNLSKKVLTDPKDAARYTKTLEGKTELDALMNVAIGAGVDVSLETYQQAREGDFNALRIIGSAVIGGAISDPNRIGLKLGFKPSGDAVIEEYNEFGSKTEAARVVTNGDIPMIDRSTDAVVLERKERRSILTGRSEENRFDNPRILRAEQIAGTIDKNVTADSNLNVYRLDGRSGELSVGERVTANPHIADVYGGKVNPQAVMRAGDLVRTSRGDYLYVPKSAIEGNPKLPPVSLSVDKNIRGQVTNREKLEAKAAKNKGKEAIRQQEAPAKLQKIKDDLAIKQQETADKLAVESEAKKVKLEASIKKTQAEEKTAVAAEKAKVKKEEAVITKRLTKDKADIDARRRKELAEESIAHRNRLKKANTDKQKLKEAVRFGNKQASIRSKATKDKIKLKVASDKVVAKIVDGTSEISKTAQASVIKTRAEINELKNTAPKPTKAIVKDRIDVKKTSQTKPKLQQSETNTPAPEQTTLIGTKKVETQSLIKNAVEEARGFVKAAQDAGDESVTTQMGTTFVEQRKLAAEFLAKKGFEKGLREAIDMTDVELSKLGVDRAALYERFSKTAIENDQFVVFRDQLEELSIKVGDTQSVDAQGLSLSRMATQNDPFRRLVALRKKMIDNEKSKRGTVFTDEVDELYAMLKTAGNLEDVQKVIKDNLCTK
tara:strand:+ start:15477 stop:17972 length:2496 start_codon:yes stop_codon:yes gene_type:complete